jgi:hypothetical protein
MAIISSPPSVIVPQLRRFTAREQDMRNRAGGGKKSDSGSARKAARTRKRRAH